MKYFSDVTKEVYNTIEEAEAAEKECLDAKEVISKIYTEAVFSAQKEKDIESTDNASKIYEMTFKTYLKACSNACEKYDKARKVYEEILNNYEDEDDIRYLSMAIYKNYEEICREASEEYGKARKIYVEILENYIAKYGYYEYHSPSIDVEYSKFYKKISIRS